MAKLTNTITSIGWDDRVYTLCREAAGQPVLASSKVTSYRGDAWKLEGGRAPHKTSSEGKVWVSRGNGPGQAEFYPSVFGLKWVVLEQVPA